MRYHVSAGSARRSLAPMTVSFPQEASLSASPLRERTDQASSLPASRRLSPAPCRWPPANMSRSARRPIPRRDLARETAELTTQPGLERQELADIYMARGLDPDLALKVADQLMADEALGAAARDAERKRAVAGKGVSGRVELGG